MLIPFTQTIWEQPLKQKAPPGDIRWAGGTPDGSGMLSFPQFEGFHTRNRVQSQKYSSGQADISLPCSSLFGDLNLGVNMQFRSYLAGGFGLAMMAACQSAPTETATAPRPVVTSVDTMWVDGADGARLHVASDGVCPLKLGEFSRTEVSGIDMTATVGEPRFDGICQYEDVDHASYMTAYFYVTDGNSISEEMQGVVESIANRWDVDYLEAESEACDMDLQLRAGMAQALEEIDQTNSIVIETGNSGRCVILSVDEPMAWTYATLGVKNDHFLKLRITTQLPTEANNIRIQDAISAFYVSQVLKNE